MPSPASLTDPTDPTMSALHPRDQAEGLRQRFAHRRTRFVPLVSNPHVSCGGILLERLCTTFTALGLRTLVVDAAERSPAPRELSLLDLAEGIEPLSRLVSYLAARGLSLRHVDARGSTEGFLHALADAAPGAGVVLVHASASEIARMFAHLDVRPLLLAADHPDSVTHAYGGLKVLATRAHLMAHDLLIAAPAGSPRTARIAEHIAGCADAFLGAVVHDWVSVDPADDALDPPSPELLRLAADLLEACDGALDAPTAPDAQPWRHSRAGGLAVAASA